LHYVYICIILDEIIELMWNRETIQVMWNRARIQVSICIKRWSRWDKRSNANLIALWEKCASEITFHTPMICELCSLRRKQVHNKKGWAKKRTLSKPQSEGKAWLAMSSSAMIWRKNDLRYEGKDPSHNLTQKVWYKSCDHVKMLQWIRMYRGEC